MRLLLLASLVVSCSARASYNFDAGWKFHLGNVGQSEDALCPNSTWSHQLDGLYCPGWGHQVELPNTAPN